MSALARLLARTEPDLLMLRERVFATATTHQLARVIYIATLASSDLDA